MAGDAVGAAHAAAAAPMIEFRIPSGTLSTVLVKFAVKANISLGLGEVNACAALGPGLTGRYTVEDGLQRILNGTGCSYRMLDARAYLIQPPPRTFNASAPAPAVSPTSVKVAELVVIAPRASTPAELGPLETTEDLATAVSNVLATPPAAGCAGCSGSQAFPVLAAPPVVVPRPAPDMTAEVPEPGTWSIMLSGLGALGANLRRRRASQPFEKAASLVEPWGIEPQTSSQAIRHFRRLTRVPSRSVDDPDNHCESMG